MGFVGGRNIFCTPRLNPRSLEILGNSQLSDTGFVFEKFT